MLHHRAPSKIGRYEIKSLIGAGGMGTLYLARDTNPNTYRLVALKLLNANFESDDLRERFGREARALSALSHPNVVNIYDCGEFHGAPFIVMEYVRGETLAEKIKRQAQLTLGQKLKLMVELCGGLAHAHESGIIHRDIKPANLMVDQVGRLRLLDFGIARVHESGLTHAVLMTQVNVRIGTPGYMSPEQIEGGEIDRRSDIFAVGAVLYELLSYKEAFKGANTRQIENQVLQSQPTPLVSLIPGLDPEIERIVSKALAKDVNERYQDAAELETAIQQQVWRLGPSETPLPTVRTTPAPGQAARRKSHESKADVAHQRAVAVYHQGAFEAAKRFAVEALAENPAHEGARQLLDELDPNAWQPPLPPPTPPRAGTRGGTLQPATSPRTRADYDEYPATVLSDGDFEASSPDAPTMLHTRQSQQRSRGWQYGIAIAGAALLVALAVGISVALQSSTWFSSGDPIALTIARPQGGTISGGGIHCGTSATECSGRHSSGEVVEFEVQADQGFSFAGYTGDCAPSGRVVMTSPKTCGATFEPIPATNVSRVQTLTIAKPAGGTIYSEGIRCGTQGNECSTTRPEGTLVRLEPLADKGFTLRVFTGDCVQGGETLMSGPRTCGATFAPNAIAKRPEAPDARPQDPSPRGGTRPNIPRPSNPGDSDIPSTAPPAPKDDAKFELPEPPPPPAPPPPEVIAKKEIEEVLERYRSSYENLDYRGIQSAFPNAPAVIQNQFRQIKSLQYTFAGPPEYVKLDPYAGTAVVDLSIKQTSQMKVGSGRPSVDLKNRVNLHKAGDNRWVISSVAPK